MKLGCACLFLFASCGSTAPTATTPVATQPALVAEQPVADAGVIVSADAQLVAVPAAADPKAELLTAENKAWEAAKPVFVRACAACHTSSGAKASKKKLDHFSFDSYPPGGPHAATIGRTIREVLGLSGKKATMPSNKPGSVQGDDLAAIKAWTDAWQAAEKAGAHPTTHEHHHH
jgi:mono/diheme cytochrome c family protein